MENPNSGISRGRIKPLQAPCAEYLHFSGKKVSIHSDHFKGLNCRGLLLLSSSCRLTSTTLLPKVCNNKPVIELLNADSNKAVPSQAAAQQCCCETDRVVAWVSFRTPSSLRLSHISLARESRSGKSDSIGKSELRLILECFQRRSRQSYRVSQS